MSTRKSLIGASRIALTGATSGAFSRSAAAALAASMAAAAAPAAAQEVTGERAGARDGAKDEVIVTGSRIGRSEFESLQPSIVIDSETLETRGVVNIADALNEQAAFTLPGASPVGGQGAENNGQNQINFLGLGAARTLTLVNSKRFVPSAGAGGLQVDLNNIPLGLVERVETIAVGGAPVYGTDAIAGTVNVILKDDFEGLEITGQAGFATDEGDAFRGRTSLLAGANFDDDRGNITVAFDYNSQNGLISGDRPDTFGRGFAFEAPPASANSPFDQILIQNAIVAISDESGVPLFTNDLFAFNVLGNGIPLNPGDPNSPLSRFDDNGNLAPFVPGGGTGSPIFQSGGDGYDVNALRSVFNNSNRFQGNIFARYDLRDNVRLKVEGWLTRSESTELVNENVIQSIVFGAPGQTFDSFGTGPVPVLLSNPFVTPSTRATIGQAIDFDSNGTPDATIDTDGDGVPDSAGFYVDRAFVSSVFNNAPGRSEGALYRTVVGLDGDFDVGERNFKWEVAYTYGESTARFEQPVALRSAFNQAVNVVTDPTTGEPVCADQSNGCAPLNVMVGNPSQAAVDFVTVRNETVRRNRQHFFTANIAGDLFSLPAGNVSAALGFDYRVEQASFEPSELSRRGAFDFTEVPLRGEFDTQEYYGEALIPVFGGDFTAPLIERLEFEGAVRYVENSVAGGDVTWTAGGRYSPFSGLEFRGNVTESIRAPSIEELFLPEAQGGVLADDPCDARFINLGDFPERRAANCASEGITQPFTSFISDATFLGGTTSGNQDLENETAKSWTVGVILQPDFIPGLSIASDWIDIDIVNAIENLDGDTIFQACYDSADFANEPACNAFTRDAGGQINSFRTGFVNVGRVAFSGLNSNINYGFQTDRIGDFNFRVDHLYTNELTFTIGEGNFDPRAGEIGNSQHRVTGSIGWRYGQFSLNNQVQWFSSAVFDNADGPLTRDVSGVPSWWVLNTSLAYEIRENATLQLNVDNLFDERAPFGIPQTFGAGTNDGRRTYFSGILGRFMTINARFRF